MKALRAGSNKKAPMRNTAPGKTSMVALYTFEYNGTNTKGMRFSDNPKTEFTLPENIIKPV